MYHFISIWGDLWRTHFLHYMYSPPEIFALGAVLFLSSTVLRMWGANQRPPFVVCSLLTLLPRIATLAIRTFLKVVGVSWRQDEKNSLAKFFDIGLLCFCGDVYTDVVSAGMPMHIHVTKSHPWLLILDITWRFELRRSQLVRLLVPLALFVWSFTGNTDIPRSNLL